MARLSPISPTNTFWPKPMRMPLSGRSLGMPKRLKANSSGSTRQPTQLRVQTGDALAVVCVALAIRPDAVAGIRGIENERAVNNTQHTVQRAVSEGRGRLGTKRRRRHPLGVPLVRVEYEALGADGVLPAAREHVRGAVAKPDRPAARQRAPRDSLCVRDSSRQAVRWGK